MILGILVVVLTVAAAIALTRPWWRAAIAKRMSHTAANVAAYRLRLAEIDQEAKAGTLDATASESMKVELQQRLLQDAAEPDQPATTASNWKIALVAGVFLPLFAAIWYYQAGSWRVQEQIARSPAPMPSAGDTEAAQIEGMVQRLAQRLQEQPDDAEGWAMLGRSYFVLKRYPESAQAYARANALVPVPDPDLLVSEGGALGLAADGDLSGRPRDLFDAALKVSPDHTRGLWFAGQAAVQAGDLELGQTHWERLLQQDLPAELHAEVEAHVNDLAARTGRKAILARADATADTTRPATQPDPQLRVKVQLAPGIAGKLKSDQVLYVFAKAALGPPMPLAVQKLSPAAWPVELTLDESNGMSPALKLSQFDRWIVTARLGSEGTPTAQAGDLQGQTVVVRGKSPQNVEVVISEEVR